MITLGPKAPKQTMGYRFTVSPKLAHLQRPQAKKDLEYRTFVEAADYAAKSSNPREKLSELLKLYPRLEFRLFKDAKAAMLSGENFSKPMEQLSWIAQANINKFNRHTGLGLQALELMVQRYLSSESPSDQLQIETLLRLEEVGSHEAQMIIDELTPSVEAPSHKPVIELSQERLAAIGLAKAETN